LSNAEIDGKLQGLRVRVINDAGLVEVIKARKIEVRATTWAEERIDLSRVAVG
jgi:hypothetical protein